MRRNTNSLFLSGLVATVLTGCVGPQVGQYPQQPAKTYQNPVEWGINLAEGIIDNVDRGTIFGGQQTVVVQQPLTTTQQSWSGPSPVKSVGCIIFGVIMVKLGDRYADANGNGRPEYGEISGLMPFPKEGAFYVACTLDRIANSVRMEIYDLHGNKQSEISPVEGAFPSRGFSFRKPYNASDPRESIAIIKGYYDAMNGPSGNGPAIDQSKLQTITIINLKFRDD